MAVRRRLSLLVLVLASCGAWTALGQRTAPDAPSYYMGREIAATMHYTGAPWLVRESRQREEDCKSLMQELRVKPGQPVCDMGCGNGFYTLKLAELTGEQGKVYAVDIQEEMLELSQRRAKTAELENIVFLHGTTTDPRLPENSLDLVLMVDVYHEFSHPEEMLRAISKSLKTTGQIALAEFRAEDPDVPIKPLHKMSKNQIFKEFRANGFGREIGRLDEIELSGPMLDEMADPTGMLNDQGPVGIHPQLHLSIGIEGQDCIIGKQNFGRPIPRFEERTARQRMAAWSQVPVLSLIPSVVFKDTVGRVDINVLSEVPCRSVGRPCRGGKYAKRRAQDHFDCSRAEPLNHLHLAPPWNL